MAMKQSCQHSGHVCLWLLGAMEMNGNANGLLSPGILQFQARTPSKHPFAYSMLIYICWSPAVCSHLQQPMKGAIIPGKERAGGEMGQSRERWASDSVGNGRSGHVGNICSCWHNRAVREHVIWLTYRNAARMGPKLRGQSVCVCVCLPEPRREQEVGRDREREKTWVN